MIICTIINSFLLHDCYCLAKQAGANKIIIQIKLAKLLNLNQHLTN